MAGQITQLPDPPNRGDDQQTFTLKADALLGALPDFVTQTNAVATEVESNAITAENSASDAVNAAASAVAVTNTVKWVSGTTYNEGVTVWSPLNKLTYRRNSTGGGTTDPSLDAANWTLVTPVSGVGGTVTTGNVTLTSASSGAQSIAPTGYGQYVTLPDATTCMESAVNYLIRNTGAYPYGIKNASGTILGWIPAQQTVMVGLADNLTVAGTWNVFGADPAAVTAATVLGPSISVSLQDVVTIDANKTLVLMTTGTAFYGMVLDNSTGSFGAPTLIRNAGSALNYIQGIGVSSSQVLVCSTNSTTAFEAVILGISGTTITVNTAATTTLAGTMGVNSRGSLIALGSTFVASYGRSTNVFGLRAMTVSGTTVTIGAETAVTSNNSSSLSFAVNSITGIAFGYNGTNHFATPFTVSGTTITLGTQASWANTGVLETVRVMGTGRYITFGSSTGGLVSVSGTVATVSTFSAGFVGDVTTGNFIDGQISSNKWFYTSSVGTTVNILTDTSGTASIASTTFTNNSSDGANILGKISSTRAFLYTVEQGPTPSGGFLAYTPYRIIEIDVSGATPSIQRVSTIDTPYLDSGGTDTETYRFGYIPTPYRAYPACVPLQATSGGLSQMIWKTPGNPQTLGVDSSLGIVIGSANQILFDGSGVQVKPINSLNIQPVRNIRAGSGGAFTIPLNALHVNTRKSIGQGGSANTAFTIFCMESVG